MKKKVLALVLCVAMAATLAVGCGGKAEEPAAPADTAAEDTAEEPAAEETTGEAKNIAYITPSTTTPFWNWVEAGIQAQCDTEGWNLTVFDSANDAATQLKNAQNAITSQVDAIVISPTDSASCPAVLDEAEAAGIPVIICDIGTDEGEYLAMVATPNYDGAYECGKYLADYLKENNLTGSIGEITIPLSRINGQLRTSGFEDAVKEAGFEVTTVLETSDFTVDEADTQTRNIVTANSDLVAVFANHDQATLGAVSAVTDLGLTGKVLVVSFDGNPDIVNALKNGDVLVCSAQQAKKMGKESVNALVAHFNGETVEKQIDVPTILLTKDNVEEHLTEIDEDVCGLE